MTPELQNEDWLYILFGPIILIIYLQLNCKVQSLWIVQIKNLIIWKLIILLDKFSISESKFWIWIHWFQIQHFRLNTYLGPDPDPILIQSFDDPENGKKFDNFFIENCNLLILWPFIKDVQATGEAFSSQKRTSSTSENEISQHFIFLWVIFALLDPDPDPDPLTWSTLSMFQYMKRH